MPFGFGLWSDYYYLFIILQIVCIVHCIKTGRRDWLYILIFLPALGAIAYFIMELLPGWSRSGFSMEGIQRALFPQMKIRELEQRLRIANTDANRLNLAAEYAAQKQYGKAVELTKACLTGIYANDPDIMKEVARLYFYNGQPTESLDYYNRALNLKGNSPRRPEEELLYARALDATGNTEKAEEEYKRIVRVHHSMEAMYYYGMLLKKLGRAQEARVQFQTIQQDKHLHPKYVRRLNAEWIRLSKKELNA